MAGLQIFDGAGNVILDSNNSICRVVGTTVVSGSGSVDVFSGRPWFAVLNENSYDWQEMSFNFNVSGTILSWAPFPPEPMSPVPPTITIVYGAY